MSEKQMKTLLGEIDCMIVIYGGYNRETVHDE